MRISPCCATRAGSRSKGDLYRAGLTSHASVNVMLALEDAFDIEFPDALLKKSTFESIAAIADALDPSGSRPRDGRG